MLYVKICPVPWTDTNSYDPNAVTEFGIPVLDGTTLVTVGLRTGGGSVDDTGVPPHPASAPIRPAEHAKNLATPKTLVTDRPLRKRISAVILQFPPVSILTIIFGKP